MCTKFDIALALKNPVLCCHSLTLFKALCAIPHIFAVTDSEYNADRVSFVVRLNSTDSDIGGVVSPELVLREPLDVLEIFWKFVRNHVLQIYVEDSTELNASLSKFKAAS